MGDVRVLVLRTAGINCDEEVMHCWRLAGAKPELLHVNVLAERPAMLDGYAVVTIPGGFSYGDDIAAGAILARRLLQTLADPLRKFVERGGGVFGICNGFQVLVKMGLLPGGDVGRDQVTVTFNDSAQFEARWVRLQVCTDRCPFLTPIAGRAVPAIVEWAPPTDPSRERERPVDRPVAGAPGSDRVATGGGMPPSTILELPVEHAEGRVVTAGDTVARELLERGQLALRYVDADGRTDRYPANPNGSTAGIAGLCDPTGRVFGLMPHPDRHFDHTHHPLWTRRPPTAPPDGLTFFQNAVCHWKNS